MFMTKILDRGDAEQVTTEGASGYTWYIPHHGVYHLLTGPDFTNTLTGFLCRFRQHPVAIMCDVEKMFHQFVVHEADRDFLRFLWWEDGNLDAEPKEYCMKVHLFGVGRVESERAIDVKDLDLSNERLPMEQTLGIKWNVEDDVFCFKFVGRVHLLHGAVCFPSYLIRWDFSPLSS